MTEELDYESVEYLDEFLQEVQEENSENVDSIEEEIIEYDEEEVIDVCIYKLLEFYPYRLLNSYFFVISSVSMKLSFIQHPVADSNYHLMDLFSIMRRQLECEAILSVEIRILDVLHELQL